MTRAESRRAELPGAGRGIARPGNRGDGRRSPRRGRQRFVAAPARLRRRSLQGCAEPRRRSRSRGLEGARGGRRTALGRHRHGRPHARGRAGVSGVVAGCRYPSPRHRDGRQADVADEVGARLGVDKVYAEHSPEEKLDVVRAMQRSSELSPVLMVGDGINDAPALALADVGIAMGAAGQLRRRRRLTPSSCSIASTGLPMPCALAVARCNRPPERAFRHGPERDPHVLRSCRPDPAGARRIPSGGDRRRRDPQRAAGSSRLTALT